MTEPPFSHPHDEGQPPPETHQQETHQFPVVPQPRAPFLQRNRVPLLAGAVVFVLVVAGGVWAIAASSGSADAAPPPATSSAPSSPAAPPAAKHAAVTRGTVTGEDGGTWTVKTESGSTVTVAVSDKTKFGTVKAPVDKAKIVVDSKVVITGQDKDGTVQARRIRLAES